MSQNSESGSAAPKPKPSRLGRGLMDLIGEQAFEPKAASVSAPAPSALASAPNVADEDRLNAQQIAISLISPNASQPRQTFDEDELNELATSIRAKGVLQAILVRPNPTEPGRYQIVAGERRWRAAQRAGLEKIPAVIRSLDELEVAEIAIIENVQRSDLNPVDEAEAYQALMKRFGRTQENLAEQVGKSRPHITNTLRLLNLPDEARDLVRKGVVSAGHARAALGAPEPMSVIEKIVSSGLTVREAERLAHKLRLASEEVETKPAKDNQPAKDVDTEALESDLAHALGLTVEIRHKGVRGGELRIKYAELEQLDDVCRRLTSGRSSR